MNRHTIYILSVILSIAFGCTHKERLNPLDPQNSETDGKVTGIRIYSEFDTVILSWSKVYVDDLLGYNIYRRTLSDSVFSPIDRINHNVSQFYDDDVEYGKRYTYRVSAVTSYFESPLSDSVSIVPGPSVVWISDVDQGRIKWLSDDIIHEIGRKNTGGYPWDLVVSGHERTIWYTDIQWGYVVKVDDFWKTYSSKDIYWDPVDIALDEHRNLLWVANQNGSVIQIHTSLYDSLMEIRHEDFKNPRSVALDEFSGIAWVADPNARAIFRISPYRGSVRKLSESFIRPMQVAINEQDATIWVADSSRVVRLGRDERIEFIIEGSFNFALALDIDVENESVWIVDFLSISEGSRVYKFNFQGIQELILDGFDFPRNLVVNHYDHSCIVVDSGAGEVVKISEDGMMMGKSSEFLYPVGVYLEYDE
ncbi:hypothetical protein JXB12_00295 [candidate division KSB1 bacterium]|nr:hypothetical protein [candidate division KSB1 bacterium]